MVRLIPLVQVSLLTILLASSCRSTKLADVYSPKEWRDLLKSAGGWVPLAIPDSKYRPGAIVEVKKGGEVRWISHVGRCCPDNALAIEHGYIPPVTFTKRRTLGAHLIAELDWVEAKSEVKRVAKVELVMNDHNAEALDIVQFKIACTEHPDYRAAFAPCLSELQKQDRYLVTEALRLSKATYTLRDESGAEIGLENRSELGELLKIEAGVDYEVTTEGQLVINRPTYIAVRRAVRVDSDWNTLGDPSQARSADALIEEAFLRSTK